MDDYNYSHLHVTFFTEAVKDEAASAKEGRPVFSDQEFVRIKFVGDKNNELVAPAHSFGTMRDRETNQRFTYAQQFYKHYEAFQRNAEQRGTGSPLEELGLSQAKIKELNAANVFTVESLAGLDGTLLQKLGMGARDLKKQAEQYLSKTRDSAAFNKLESENAELRRMIEDMQARMNTIAPVSQTATSYENSLSPFADWDEDTIRIWLDEQGAPKPHHKAGKAKRVELADEWNEKLAKDKAA